MTTRSLIVSLQGIGNAILALPAAKALHEAGDEVTLLTLSPRSVAVFSRVPYLSGVLAAGDAQFRGVTGRLRLLAALRRKKFDRALFSFPSGANSYRFGRLAGVPQRWGHRYPEVGRAWRHLTAHRVALRQGHDLEQNLQLIEALGLPHAAADLWPCLSAPTDLAERGARYLAAQGFDPQARYVGLHTGCDGAWVEKRWPEMHFATLAEKLHEHYGLAAIVMDGPAEIGAGRQVARLACTPVLAMEGYGDLGDAWGLMARCDVFVSNDSGLMNLAAASGVPTVAVFGPSESHRTRPYGPRGRAVVTDRTCAPCYGLVRYPGCPFPYQHCLAGLSPARVLAAVEELLAP